MLGLQVQMLFNFFKYYFDSISAQKIIYCIQVGQPIKIRDRDKSNNNKEIYTLKYSFEEVLFIISYLISI